MDGVTAALPPFQAPFAPEDEELAAEFLADVPRDVWSARGDEVWVEIPAASLRQLSR